MLVARIKDNKPLCPKCVVLLKEESTDVFLVESEDERFFEFHRRCTKCGKMFKYYTDTSFESRTILEGREVKRVNNNDTGENTYDEEELILVRL